jgi:DAACS family dicarboxylate/amino acid:cation (Na+ or H+) symporter
MIVVPLVFVSLVSGAASMGNLSKLGRISVKTLAYYLITTGIAVFIGLTMANVFQPGAGLNLSIEGLKAKEVTPPGAIQTLLNIIPLNPFDSLASGNLLQTIFFAIFFGFALSALGEIGTPLTKIFDAANAVMIKITAAVMQYAPYGVCALIAYTVGSSGVHVLLPLIKLIGLMYLAAVIQICIVYLPLIKGVAGLNLKTYLRIMTQLCSSPSRPVPARQLCLPTLPPRKRPVFPAISPASPFPLEPRLTWTERPCISAWQQCLSPRFTESN